MSVKAASSGLTASSESPLKIGYVLLRFPKLTETFVAEEIAALQASGLTIKIISLLAPWREPLQPKSRELLRVTWYAPGFVRPSLLGAQFHFLRRSPALYFSLLRTLLRQPYPARPLPTFMKRLGIFAKAVASARYLEKESVQALHAHFAWLSGAAAWVIAKLLNRPYTVTVHAYDLYGLNDLLPLVCAGARHVITISEYNRKEIARLKACPDEKVSVIRCGIDLGRFRSEVGAAARTPSGKTLRILSIGSLIPKKGHADLLAACALLKERGTDFGCTIVGSGPEEGLLRGLVRSHGLDEHVRLTGPLPSPEVASEFRKHDVFALACTLAPSGDRDGIPVVLMEAGAMGLPLVSTRVSGIPELVRPGSSGLLVPPADPAALADALAALASNPELRSALGRSAQDLVARDYDIIRNAGRLRDIFRACVVELP